MEYGNALMLHEIVVKVSPRLQADILCRAFLVVLEVKKVGSGTFNSSNKTVKLQRSASCSHMFK